tara:strand:- start:335 stop:868 length:534 start_codon:yes stop_codon:yes gene_type:complete
MATTACDNGSTSGAAHKDAPRKGSTKSGKQKAANDDQPPRKKSRSTPAKTFCRMVHASLEEPGMKAFLEHEDSVDLQALWVLPPEEVIRKYLRFKNDKYHSEHVESLAQLLQMFMELPTDNYESLGTLKEYIRTASKADVVSFLRREVLGANSCRQVCDKYVAACYRAVFAFAAIVG